MLNTHIGVGWGGSFRIILSKSRELMRATEDMQLKVVSTEEPTYWPLDRKEPSNLVDFAITKGNVQILSGAFFISLVYPNNILIHNC